MEQVEQSLRTSIISLDFVPGELIDKRAVCARLGVSMFPVSEALARLAVEGLVEVLPQRGTRVTRIHLRVIREFMLIRQALEELVARQQLPDDHLLRWAYFGVIWRPRSKLLRERIHRDFITLT